MRMNGRPWGKIFQARAERTRTLGAPLSDLVTRLMAGRDPHGERIQSSAGARMCVNIAAAHIPSFCAASHSQDAPAYRNTYDLAAANPLLVNARRRQIDAALPMGHGQAPEDTYFGAVELTGAGIRFYGDFALILRADAISEDTCLLDRNSFELLRPPLLRAINARMKHAGGFVAALKRVASMHGGTWSKDLIGMMGLKLLNAGLPGSRGVTAGMITSRVIEDEDYVEVLRHGSFNAFDLQESRVAASDAGAEARIGDHLLHGPTPRAAELLWRHQRRLAVKALQKAGISTHTVVTLGRVRS